MFSILKPAVSDLQTVERLYCGQVAARYAKTCCYRKDSERNRRGKFGPEAFGIAFPPSTCPSETIQQPACITNKTRTN